MIRVLHVIGAMNRGGAETFIMNVYRAIDRTRIQFDFLVLTNKESDYDAEIYELGGKIYTAPWFTGFNGHTFRTAVARFFREHPEHPIVHGHIGSSAAIYLAEAKKQGRYTIAHSHAADGPFSFSQAAYKFLAYPTRKIADYFFACSFKAGKDRFGTKIMQDTSRYTIINNGINLEAFASSPGNHLAAKKALGLSDAVVYGHVGRFVEAKNHSFLVDVFTEIKQLQPNAYLLLVGEGPLQEDIQNKVRALNLEDSVLFTDATPKPKEYLEAMDAFIFPSLYEGLGIALIEAQAAGLPCVVSENIVDLAVVTKFVQRIPLSSGKKQWAQACITAASQRNAALELGVDILRMHGFDIKEVAAWLISFYENHTLA